METNQEKSLENIKFYLEKNFVQNDENDINRRFEESENKSS